jgi:hypothetical protein
MAASIHGLFPETPLADAASQVVSKYSPLSTTIETPCFV